MSQWRETPSGERQWLGGDGNWYSSEQMAVAAAGAPEPTQAPVPPPPTVYRRPETRRSRSKWLRPRPLIILSVLAVAIVLIVTLGTTSSGPYKVDQISVQHAGTATLYVSFRVHNLGSSASTPSCTVSVISPSPTVGGVGANILSTQSPIDASQYGSIEGPVVITDNDALDMNVSDVTITC